MGYVVGVPDLSRSKMKKLVLENRRISRGELAQEMSISLK